MIKSCITQLRRHYQPISAICCHLMLLSGYIGIIQMESLYNISCTDVCIIISTFGALIMAAGLLSLFTGPVDRCYVGIIVLFPVITLSLLIPMVTEDIINIEYCESMIAGASIVFGFSLLCLTYVAYQRYKFLEESSFTL